MAPPVQLPTRPLGKNGPQVPRIGLGMMGEAGSYGVKAEEAERLDFLDQAYAMGETFWDTANLYGDSEQILGKWFANNPDKREDIFLATKFGIPPDHNPLKPDASPENARRCLDESLARLGLPHVDLFYLHMVDRVTPIEKTVRAMADLKAAGKVRHLGLCNCSADTLRRAHAVHPIAAVQMEYSLLERELESPERSVLQTARELGIALVAYSPLSKGHLSGAIRTLEDVNKDGDFRGKRLPRFSEENFAKNLELIDRVGAIGAAAKPRPATTPQVALAWLLAQGDDIFPIPGASKPARVATNLEAFGVELSPPQLEELSGLAARVAGDRFPPPFGDLVFASTPALEE